MTRARKRRIRRAVWITIFSLAIIGAFTLIYLIIRLVSASPLISKKTESLVIEEEPELRVRLLTPNEYSRPQTVLEHVNGIVIHYTANPLSTGNQNRNYFEGLKDSHETYASSHFIVGLDGEIIQCIPTSEISYASNNRNNDTLSIECCHPDDTGKFNTLTYDKLVELTAWLCGKFNLDPSTDIIRHYDITGKSCPKYYVDHPEEWEGFKKDVAAYLKLHGVKTEN